MGISHKVAPAIDGNFSFNHASLLEFGPDDRSDRPSDLLRDLEFSVREEQHVKEQRLSAALGEQILALYDEYRPRLFRYIRNMNLNRDQAEEVIQETFMRLTTQLLQADDIDNLQGWIVRVAHNFAVDVHKKNDRDSAGTSDRIFALENRIDPTPNPEEAYSKKEQIERMEIALSTFNLQQRQCFLLRAQGFRYKDIGIAFGISGQRAALIVKQVAVRLAAICGQNDG
jgi:RNA polymerase sigma-70 factor, ECF subfamily